MGGFIYYIAISLAGNLIIRTQRICGTTMCMLESIYFMQIKYIFLPNLTSTFKCLNEVKLSFKKKNSAMDSEIINMMGLRRA